jgi:hypothetical protein
MILLLVLEFFVWRYSMEVTRLHDVDNDVPLAEMVSMERLLNLVSRVNGH